MYLIGLTAHSIKDFRPISDLEEARFRDALRHLHDFDQARQIISIIAGNRAALEACIRRADRFDPPDGQARPLSRSLGIEANRCFINFLASCRLYLDASQARLTRRYGAGSDVLSEFKAACSHEYDNTFAYRFLYKLRDYAQHIDVPIGSALLNSQVVKGPPERSVHRVTLALNTRKLLESGGPLWKKDLRLEVESTSEKLDVLPLVDDATRCFTTIDRKRCELERSKLLESAGAIAEIGAEAIAAGYTPAIGFSEQLNETQIGMELGQAPPVVMRWLGCDWFRTTAG